MSVLTLLEVGSKIPQMLGSSSGEMASRLPDLFRAMGSDSLVEFTQTTQVSPIAIVDAALQSNPNISPILKMCNILVGSYYLMAISIMLRHDGVAIAEILDSVNPNRNVGDSIARSAGTLLSGLNDDSWAGYSMPKYDADLKKMVVGNTPRLNALNAGLNAAENAKASPDVEAYDKEIPTMSLHKDVMNTLYGSGNLATGTMVDVIFESRDRKVSVPVMINVAVNHLSSMGCVDLLNHVEKDVSLKQRYWEWKNGLIDTFDFVTAVDLVDQHAEALRRDTTGLYAELRRRKKKNTFAGFLAGLAALKGGLNNGRPNGLSVATASNIFIIDSTTKAKLEQQMGGLLEDVRVRTRIFANSYAMMILVVDAAWETVTIYIRGHAKASEYKISDIKTVSSKGSSAEMIALGEAAMSKLSAPTLNGSRFG